jgi:hypothetical protein
VIKYIFIILVLTGCTPNIIDYDAEKLVQVQSDKIKKSQADPFNNNLTPAYVKLAEDEDNNIFIEAIKLKPIKRGDGILLDVWRINAINRTSTPKCVKINWKLQDFEFETTLPYIFLIKGNEILKVGKMQQTIWSFDDVAIAIPPSGYIEDLKIINASLDEKKKYTCENLDDHVDEI